MAMKFWVTAPFFYPDMNRPWSDLLNDMLSIVDAAEDLGFEGITINENQFQNYVANPSALTFAAVAAARTKRLRIVPGVVVLPAYNPLLIASEISLLDHLAPGRTGVGVARGGSRYTLDRIGVDPAEARAIYEESLEIIRRLWVEDEVEYDGKYFSFPSTTLVPKPATKPHPDLWVASQSVDGARKVGQQGLNLITAPNYGSFEPHGDFEALLQSYNDAVAESGKPRGEVMALRHTWVGRTEEEATRFFDDFVNEYNYYMSLVKGEGTTGSREERLAARGLGEKREREFVTAGRMKPEQYSISSDNLYEKYADPVLTTPDRMIERFKGYEEMGVDHLACLVAVGMPIEEVIKNMKMMAEEVLPAFR
ncbi:Flavin-dependent oxidoreductase, luciferase family (includes alkanesulfonate monooxygenase SsuD and methylene tetrahydromethanopterin reductase) [Pseudonocardia ammonioxydans]|uniref:Flavin-dependent oxidoreductase, luciferase family (Includes alkanesulfonate monooxygenase SsuD and methylene tetrahydromethanopterin reductase) n=2 Tax=Pseudonocardia ammonioxydans TaxID=260086 RepID=A0A1I5HE78_PSUAM|nr:Flavin-dependent oxidoreductase, luciferase family (includes alkanesulfonate monooxygenase SsuD and methylene tetrahydromethanopterin reductase) [Pseudonocardia ammonioxydans]